MKNILLLAALTLAFHLHAADSAPTETREATISMQRVMVAGPNGQRICHSMIQFNLPNNQSLALNAADKSTENVAAADTTKPVSVTTTKDPATQSTIILRVDQAGSTLYVRPDPALAKKE